MTFAADFAAAGVEALLAVFGEQVTYTPAGGVAVTPTAIVGPEQADERPTLDGREIVIIRPVTIRTDPTAAEGGVAAPSTEDTVTYNGTTYAVEAIESNADGFCRLRVTRKPTIERSRPAYRGQGR